MLPIKRLDRLLRIFWLGLFTLIAVPAWALDVEVGGQALRDYTAAYNEFRPLAERGNAVAQFNMGVMYANGQGVKQDHAEAVRWFRMAAAQGYANAQRNLGVMYTLGRGVQQDYVQGYLWSELSAARGDKESALLRNTLMKEMTEEQIAEARKLVREWKPK